MMEYGVDNNERIRIEYLQNMELPCNIFNECLPQPAEKKKEKELATYVCFICRKTFYNKIALWNHKSMQHDSLDWGKENYLHTVNEIDLMMGVASDFQLIPLKISNKDVKVKQDGFTKRTYSNDTSYIILEYESRENAKTKKSRLDQMIKKIQPKPEKKLVDLRGPFTCTLPSSVNPEEQCHQIFFSCCQYSLHYREMHTKRRKAALNCQVCEKRLDRNLYMPNELMPQMEPPSETFTCQSCGLIFLNSAKYDEHKRVVHAKIKPHQCSICSKCFTQIGGLQQHMRMHNGIRPFICKFCTKAFTQKAGLDQHLRTHTKVKPFKCIICSKCFSQSVHLRQHMRTHTNIQPFQCPVCKKRFKQSSHLNFHMRSHVDKDSVQIMEQYNKIVQNTQDLDFLNLSNIQPVQDEDTLYYNEQLISALGSTDLNSYFLTDALF